MNCNWVFTGLYLNMAFNFSVLADMGDVMFSLSKVLCL